LAKKAKPFNPFDPNSIKPKAKPRLDRPPTTAPRISTGPPAPIAPSEPLPPEESTSRPAIPLAHLTPDIEETSPETEPVEQPSDEPAEADLTTEAEESEGTDEPLEIQPLAVEPIADEEESPSPVTASGLDRRVGLRNQEEPEVEANEISAEERVSGLIAESKQSAAESGMDVQESPEPKKVHPDLQLTQHFVQPPKKEKGKGRPRRRKVKPPPAKRVVKLNRRKYMYFKVDLREIMEEENVPDEHRANVLGSTWAKGERSGIDAALEYVNDKEEEGILSEAAANRIRTVLKSYRTER
jgi:hypothetical protein